MKTSSSELLGSLVTTGDSTVADVIVAHCRKDFDRYVLPLVEQHYLHIGSFSEKFRLGSCDVYATGAYVMLLLRKIPLLESLCFRGKRTPRVFFKLFLLCVQQRKDIIFAAAFNTLIDHVFDHELCDIPPKKRAAIICSIIDGEKNVMGSLKLLSVLVHELKDYDLSLFKLWANKEANNLLGKKGKLCFRMYGVDASMRLLAATIKEKNIDIMIAVGSFVQMIDDYMDAKRDKKAKVQNPFLTGEWTKSSITTQYATIKKMLLLYTKDPILSQLLAATFDHCATELITKMDSGVAV